MPRFAAILLAAMLLIPSAGAQAPADPTGFAVGRQQTASEFKQFRFGPSDVASAEHPYLIPGVSTSELVGKVVLAYASASGTWFSVPGIDVSRQLSASMSSSMTAGGLLIVLHTANAANDEALPMALDDVHLYIVPEAKGAPLPGGRQLERRRYRLERD
jgi:hypothetical protein